MPREKSESKRHPEAQNEASEKLLEQIGLRRFTPTELRTANERLIRAISIGINRSSDPTTTDGGVPAIPSPIGPVTPEQVRDVPDNTRVFAVCWGGTNQRSGIGAKDGHRVFVDQHNKLQVPKDQRTLSTDDFAVMIGRHVLDGVKDFPRSELRGIQAIGVSLGIPQYNSVEANGVDARPWGEPSNWRFTNYDLAKSPSEHPSLNTPLITFLSNQGLDVDKAYFQPDPVAISHDISGHEDPNAVFLPISILAGTGTNAALNGRNLEISSSYNLFPDDRILAEMEQRGYLPRDVENPNITKMRTGGQRIKLRVAAAMYLLSEVGKIKAITADKISEILHQQQNGPILSQIASGELPLQALNYEYNALFSQEDYRMLRLASIKALEQAGQVLGVIISSVSIVAGYDGKSRVHVPTEGSVIKDGYSVRDQAEETLNLLLPKHKIQLHDASDLRGVATFAMVQARTKS